MTMQKPFAVDIDDVLGHLGQLLNTSLNTMTGRAVPFESWSHFRIFEFYGIGIEQFLNRIIEEQLLTAMAPCEGAQQALSSIRQAGSDVVLITARGYHPQAESVTLEWLDRHGMPYDDLIVVPEGQSKGEAAKHRYPQGFSVMIDDNASNLDSMKSFGLVQQAVLIDQPWNQARADYRQGINRFTGLHQFIQNLKQKYPSRLVNAECACEF